jgi:uncharacterized membrane protein YhhN
LTAFVNIFSIKHEKYAVRIVSKICLVPLLIIFYIFKSNNLSFIIILALFFSWCGDILLINPRRFRLCAGILSFLAAHILYILVFIDLAPGIDTIPFIFSLLFILTIECFLMIKLHIPNNYIFPVTIYGISIGLLFVFALRVFIWNKNPAGILLVAGSVLFFISDAVLAYFSVIKLMTKNALAIVMLTYIIAQACIVIGCIHLTIRPVQ